MSQESETRAAARARRDRWIFAGLMLLGFAILASRAIPMLGQKGHIVTGVVQNVRVERHDDTGQRILDLKVRLEDGRVVAVTAPATNLPKLDDKVRLAEKKAKDGTTSFVWDGLVNR